MPCYDFYIQSAFRKISMAGLKKKGGCRLTLEECIAISNHCGLHEGIGNYDEWEFDEDGEHVDKNMR